MNKSIPVDRRVAFRKNVHMVGLIGNNGQDVPFESHNLSVGGMAITVHDADNLTENCVVSLRMPTLNLEASAWVTRKETSGANTAMLGIKFLRFGPIAEGHLAVIPRPYEAYEVVELSAH